MWTERVSFRLGLRGGLLLACLWVGTFLGGAQVFPAPPGAYSFKGYGVDQGLSNLSVTAMTQDARGFIWVGTEDGLFRLEGGRLHRYGPEEGLADPGIDSPGLSATGKGGLWVRSQTGRNYWWDGKRFHVPSDLGVPGFDDKAGTVLPHGGLIINQGGFKRFLFTGAGAHRELVGLPQVQGLAGGWLSPDGRELMVMLGTRLWLQRGTDWDSRDLGTHLRGAAQALLKDRKGRIWVRSLRGMLRMDSWEAPLQDLSDRTPLASVNRPYLVEDGLGRVWTNTPGSLVWFGEDAEDVGLLGEAEGLPQGGASVLMVDREGSLWVGGDGIHRLLGRFLWSGYTRRQGLPAHVVWSVARSSDGVLWAGTSGGLAQGDGKGWRLLPGTEQRQFFAFAEDASGNFLAGPGVEETEATRLLVHRAGRPGVEEVRPTGLKPGEGIASLAWDIRGHFWMGAGSHLYKLEQRGGAWQATQEPVPGWTDQSLGITAIAPETNGTVWAAGGEGLACWQNGRWQTLQQEGGLEEASLMSVAAAHDGTAWVAYRNLKALSRVGWRDGRLQVLETFRHPHPLANNLITSLKVDGSGILWMGTSLGVKRWDGKHLERYGRDWGLPGEDCAQNALWIEPNGDIWAGLSVGLGHYSTQAEQGALAPVASEISGIQDGRGQAYLAGAEAFKVTWRWRTLTFSVTSLSYLNESSLRRQVRLVGFEDDWRDLEGREARYTGLHAGSFTFEVRSGRGEDAWGPVVSQPLVILRPWWQTWWFYVGVGGLAAWLFYRGFRWREAFVMRRMVELEKQVHERTWDLEEANKALEVASMVDPLTGLKNRRFLRLAMPEAEARSVRVHRHSQEELARGEDILFLLVDLDHFKHVNDTYGHPAGDEVLRSVAELLRATCRESDTLVRWGGEEFLIVAAGADRFGAEVLAENLCSRFRAEPFRLPGGQELAITCSVGFAAFPLLPGYPTAHPWEGAVEVADQCLYAAKKSGRNGWVGVFREDLEAGDDLRERLPHGVAELVREEGLTLRCSFPDPRALVWADGPS